MMMGADIEQDAYLCVVNESFSNSIIRRQFCVFWLEID
jgi:hypothetical protein